MSETSRFSAEQARRSARRSGSTGQPCPSTSSSSARAWTSSWSTGRRPATDVTGDDPIMTGKIALAHLNEFPDYYTRLDAMEAEAEAEWERRRSKT